MPLIIAVSSFLSSGHIGLGAIVPALQGLGHETISLPTVVLSNHPGRSRIAGFHVPPDDILAMSEALMSQIDRSAVAAILTGYLPTRAHVGAARTLVENVKTSAPGAIYVCDPVLGDHPQGLYIDPHAAAAIRDDLIPLAGAVTPNAFELEWLTGLPADSLSAAQEAARALRRPAVFATSIPDGARALATLLVTKKQALASAGPRLDQVPHGTGDLLAGLLTGLLADGVPAAKALARAAATLRHVIQDSAGHPDLVLRPAAPGWLNHPGHDLRDLDAPGG